MANELTETQRDQRTFDAMREDLVEKGETGKFALVANGKLVGLYTTEAEAYAEGLKQFGARGSFVIDVVGPKRPQSVSLSWDLGLMLAP